MLYRLPLHTTVTELWSNTLAATLLAWHAHDDKHRLSRRKVFGTAAMQVAVKFVAGMA